MSVRHLLADASAGLTTRMRAMSTSGDRMTMSRHSQTLSSPLPFFTCVVLVLACHRAAAQQAVSPAQKQSAVEPSAAARALLENAEVTPEGGINFYTTKDGVRRRSFSITPLGSIVAGGVSRAGTPLTNEPPTIDPVEYDKAGAHGGRDWIHDFYFGRFEQGEGQPRLYTRGTGRFARHPVGTNRTRQPDDALRRAA
jgi:hypothetical protein